jgi:TonB family protein
MQANTLAKPASADSSMPHVHHETARKEGLRANAAQAPTGGRTTYVGPTIIQQVRPRIPVSIASQVTTEQTVQITADIDAEGMVTNAQLTASKGRTSALLGPAALDAVRRYRFRPASRNGVSIPSQSVISFRFKP